jgi:hypothetical protein
VYYTNNYNEPIYLKNGDLPQLKERHNDWVNEFLLHQVRVLDIVLTFVHPKATKMYL